MPPRARFGRYPRASLNIQGAILAAGRELEAMRDRLVMDAWQNGGIFEGKKATDAMVLAYWKGKIKGLDKTDPLYETYKNQVFQLQYGIEQSKADLAHIQGKLSDSGYANFFLKWANKVPRNSEFWRTLQKDAAQMIERAKATGRANAEKRKRDAFNSFVRNTTREDIAVGDALTAAVSAMSQETGMSVTGNGQQLLDLLTADVANHPEKYHALLTAIKADDPNWDGKITLNYFSSHIESAVKGYDAIADRAYSEGYASIYSSATSNQTEMAKWGQNLDVWPVAKSYDVAYKAYAKVMNDPTSTIIDRQNASSTFAGAVSGLAATPGLPEGTKAMLTADAARVLGNDGGDAPSFGETMLGHAGITPQAQAQAAYDAQQVALMQANPGAYVYASADQYGQFDPTGRGSVGIVPASSVPANAVFVPQAGKTGKPAMVAVQPHSIMAQDPNDPNADKVEIGKVITYQVGGKTVTLYGYTDDAGAAHWSPSSPLADGSTAAFDKDGNLQVTLPGATTADPLTKAAALDAKYGTQLAAALKAGSTEPSVTQYQRDENGKITSKITIKVKNGTDFTVTQSNMTYDETGRMTEQAAIPVDLNSSPQQVRAGALAPSRAQAGNVPGVTFDSPTAAAVWESRNTLTGDQMGDLSKDPTFQATFLQQTMQTYGTSNPLDPRIKAAWDQATRSAQPQVYDSDRSMWVPAKERKDLTYPSAPNLDPTSQATLSIAFNNGTLKLPGVPNYLAGQTVAPQDVLAHPELLVQAAQQLFKTTGGGAAGAAAAAALSQPPPPPPTAPTPTVTPTPKPTTTTVTPTAVPKPTTPAPTTPSPAPAPGNTGGPGGPRRI